MKYLTCLLLPLATTLGLSAQVIEFDIVGQGGSGLLGSNELHATATPGSGGELNSGITYNTATQILTVDIGWGSSNGFTDLSGPATGAHIHGDAGQSGTAGVVLNFGTNADFSFATGASNGGVTGASDISGLTTADLLAGNWYINIHTEDNSSGEIRGNLVQVSAVPEPSTFALLIGFGALGMVSTRRRRRCTAAV
ncbi:MAG: hypothetical protein SynsKO_15500 [Synoicihabitans sp.]